MTTKVIKSTYENGQRVVEQLVMYDKSDDLFTLANIQRRYERLVKSLETAIDEAEINSIKESMKLVEAEIAEQQAIIDGYEEASE